jgi:CRP-like cAMP-binding protein
MHDIAALQRAIQASSTFASLPANLVARVAAIGHHVRYEADDTIYEVGAPADAIYLVLQGHVEHAFEPGVVGVEDLTRVVGAGAIFGWSALLQNPPGGDLQRRLAKTVSRGPSEILVIPAQALMDILESAPDVKQAVVRNLLDMVRDVYGFAGFVKVRDCFVAARLPSSPTDVAKDYDTFAF